MTINFLQPKQYYIFNETEFSKSFNSFDWVSYGKIPNDIESNQKLFTETDTHWEIHKPFDDSNSDNLPLSDISFLRGEGMR